MVGLADRIVAEPWQIVVAPENVTVGVSKTVTTKEAVGLVPFALVAEQ